MLPVKCGGESIKKSRLLWIAALLLGAAALAACSGGSPQPPGPSPVPSQQSSASASASPSASPLCPQPALDLGNGAGLKVNGVDVPKAVRTMAEALCIGVTLDLVPRGKQHVCEVPGNASQIMQGSVATVALCVVSDHLVFLITEEVKIAWRTFPPVLIWYGFGRVLSQIRTQTVSSIDSASDICAAGWLTALMPTTNKKRTRTEFEGAIRRVTTTPDVDATVTIAMIGFDMQALGTPLDVCKMG